MSLRDLLAWPVKTLLRVELSGRSCAFCTGLVTKHPSNLEQALTRLRIEHPNLMMQAVNARFVAGLGHLKLVVQQAWEAAARGVCLADRREVDILLRFACDSQISRAIREVGLSKDSQMIVLIVMGEECEARSVADKLQSLGTVSKRSFTPTREKLNFLMERHAMNRRALSSTIKEDAVAYLLAEKAALLISEGRRLSRPASSEVH